MRVNEPEWWPQMDCLSFDPPTESTVEVSIPKRDGAHLVMTLRLPLALGRKIKPATLAILIDAAVAAWEDAGKPTMDPELPPEGPQG